MGGRVTRRTCSILLLSLLLVSAACVDEGAAAPESEAAGGAAAGRDTAGVVAVPPAGEYPDASLLLEDFDDLYRSSGTIAEFEITIEKPDKTRTMEAKSWSRGEDKALIVIESPPRDAGTATLKVGDNLWNYLPKISRTIRVPPSMMMSSWMGTDLTNDDLIRESSYDEDYIAGETAWSPDPPGWLVSLTPKPDVPGLWDRLEVVFETEDRLPVLARYYDRKGRLARTMKFDRTSVMDGRLIPTRMTVTDRQHEGERTVLVYLDVRWNADLDDSIFSLSNLERQR